MMLRETDENLRASPRVSRHLDSGGLTRSSEKYPREEWGNSFQAKGLTESRQVCQLERGRANCNCRYLLDGITTLRSRMTGDCHVRFCERFRGEIPLYLLDFYFHSLFNIANTKSSTHFPLNHKLR